MRRLLIGLFLLVLAPPAKSWGAFLLSAEVTRNIVAGIDHMANLDYAEAREAFGQLKNLPGGDLLFPFLDGLVEMDQVIQEDRREEEIRNVFDRFLVRMAPVVDRGEAQLRGEPNNPDLLFTLGMIRGAKAAVDRTRKHYLDAYRGIRASHHHLVRVLQLDPRRVDALWPLGLYDYAVAQVPSLLKPFVGLVLPRGSRERGLERLTQAARDGFIARIPATVALARIYTGWEGRYSEALPFGEVLAARFPGNPEFLFLLALLYSETRETPRALSLAETIRQCVEQRRPHFPPELAPRYLQLRGKIAMDAGAYEEALDFFQRAIAQRNSKYAWITAWAYTRTGMIYDLRGEREKATEAYRQAMAIEKGGPAQREAERYLEEPYRK